MRILPLKYEKDSFSGKESNYFWILLNKMNIVCLNKDGMKQIENLNVEEPKLQSLLC